MIKDKFRNLWAVVKVESGIPVTIKAFLNRKDAEEQEKKFREKMNSDNDETGVFEILVKPS